MELSQRAYAKHRGISESAVRKAIKNGRVTRNKNGKLDPQKADKDWQKNTDPAQIKIANKVADVQEGRGHDSQSSSSVSLAGPSYQQSRAFKEAYSAKLIKLQFERELKRLIPADEVKISAFNAGRMVRDRILNIPDRVIPQLVGKTNIFEMKEILKTELTKALEELSTMHDRQ